MSFINQYIFQFSLDECFYQFTGRKLAGVLQYLSTSGSLIQLESWRVFKFATGSIVHLLAKLWWQFLDMYLSFDILEYNFVGFSYFKGLDNII